MVRSSFVLRLRSRRMRAPFTAGLGIVSQSKLGDTGPQEGVLRRRRKTVSGGTGPARGVRFPDSTDRPGRTSPFESVGSVRYIPCFGRSPMGQNPSVLVVDGDTDYGHALGLMLRRQGNRVRVCRTRTQALLASQREAYDLAIVDLFLVGGGAELARELARRIPRLILSLGARLGPDEVLQAALGFPVHRKASLPDLLRAPASSSNGAAFAARLPGSPPPSPAASARAREPRARGRGRGRRPVH